MYIFVPARAERNSLEEGSGRLDKQLGVLRLPHTLATTKYRPYGSCLAGGARDNIVVLSQAREGQGAPNTQAQLQRIVSLHNESESSVQRP